ncbi:MAG: BamA/TamA family outer membrane protein, partial [bacterium]
ESSSNENPPIPSFEKFYLGGQNSVRGYEFRDLAIYQGANCSNDVDQVCRGGQTAHFYNLEWRKQLVKQTMQMFIFMDAGQVSDDPWAMSFSDLKRSTGMGLRVRSPIGPINISWAKRMDESFPTADDVGETQIDFSMGTGF